MTSDHKIATLFLIALFAFPAAVLAKRVPAPVVESITHEGVRYTVPNDKGTKGYVVARDAATGKQLWTKTVFRKSICPFLEHDVQWVFIKQMRLEGGRLVIVNERREAYSLDLKTRRVKKLKRRTGSQRKANTPLKPARSIDKRLFGGASVRSPRSGNSVLVFSSGKSDFGTPPNRASLDAGNVRCYMLGIIGPAQASAGPWPHRTPS